MPNNLPSISELFSQRAYATPELPALYFKGKIVTYGQLNQNADRLTAVFVSMGLKSGDLVALCLARSPETIAIMLAIFKVGAAYVPLDRDVPLLRAQFILSDAKPSFLICEPEELSKLKNLGVDVMAKSELLAQRPKSSELTKSIRCTNDVAWLLYTSGSTGAPKGVLGTHTGIINRMRWLWNAQSFYEDEICFQHTSITVVDSCWEIWGALCGGHPLMIFEDDLVRDTDRLLHTLAKHKINRICLVPSLLSTILAIYPNLGAKVPLLKLWITSGEPLSVDLVDHFYNVAPDAILYNQYGLTETCADITSFNTASLRYRNRSQHQPYAPIGLPIDNVELYIKQNHGFSRPVAGEEGELFVGGKCLAAGYHNRPDLTEERFLLHPVDKCRIFKTGDLVSVLPNGNLVFAGRLDSLVKIFGNRVELGEIEMVLGKHPEVNSCCVISKGNDYEKKLYAYISLTTRNANLERLKSSLMSYAADSLPEFMLPTDIVVLDKFPLTSSGKIDRNALGSISNAGKYKSPCVNPATDVERWLSTAVCGLLKLDKVGMEMEFFSIGGDSLRAMLLISRIRRHFNIDISIRDFYECNNLAEVAELINIRQTSANANELELKDFHPVAGLLSPTQRRLWFMTELLPAAVYNLPYGQRLRGKLDIRMLEKSFQCFVDEHDVLQSRFRVEEGRPKLISTLSNFRLEQRTVDFNHQSPDQSHKLKGLISEYVAIPFDLKTELPFRACLYCLGEDDHLLLVVLHQIIIDDWSLNILSHELSFCYNTLKKKQSPHRAKVRHKYSDFASNCEKWAQTPAYNERLAYWKKTLADVSNNLTLPVELACQNQNRKAGYVRLTFTLSEVEKIRAVAREKKVTLFNVLFSAYGIMLHRYSNQNEFVIGTSVANRDLPQFEHVFGCFFNLLPIKFSLRPDMTFMEVINDVKQRLLDAQANEVDFDRLIQTLNNTRNNGAYTLFQTMFIWRIVEGLNLQLDGINTEPLIVENEMSEFKLLLRAVELEQGLSITIQYDTGVFSHDTIGQMADAFKRIALHGTGCPIGTIGKIILLSDQDKHRQIEEWNQTENAIPDESLGKILLKRAHDLGDRPAVVWQGNVFSYREVSRRAAQTCNAIIKLGLNPEAPIAVQVDRSPLLLYAILGIILSGHAYVPIDPTWPYNRQKFIIEDSGAKLLITSGDLHKRSPLECETVLLMERIPDMPPEVSLRESVGSDICYIIYTSGSTGKPKGVEVRKRGVVNILQDMQRRLSISESDKWLAITTVGFDIAVLELLLPFYAGAQVILAPYKTAIDPQAIKALLSREQCTIMQATPTMWWMLYEAGWKPTRGFKLLCGGETLPADLAKKFSSSAAEVWNLYGPTETTIWSTAHRMNGPNVLIGRPLSNTKLYVLDTDLQLLPIGVPGQLYIGGVGLANGYRNLDELTKAKFIDNPYSKTPEKIFATGDFARYLQDGSLECLGRIDNQIKIRGFRVELNEIERCLELHPEIQRACVTIRSNSAADQRLVAHLIPKDVKIAQAMHFSLFFFESMSSTESDPYKLCFEAVKYADKSGFSAVWTPERHFHEMGGCYPNPAVLSAAFAMVTQRLQIRAGSIVMPLHSPIRVAEEWAVVDNLSNGRVGVSFAAGWNPRDFVLAPNNFPNRRQQMRTWIQQVKKLWRGESMTVKDGKGKNIPITSFPRPIQKELPVWLTVGGSKDGFIAAGQMGANVLTHLLSQNLESLTEGIKLYRESLSDSGFASDKGVVTVMVHTYLDDSVSAAIGICRQPFCDYLRAHIDLERMADSLGADALSRSGLDEHEIISRAFDRYVSSAALIGDIESGNRFVRKLKQCGVDEVACLIDFGIPHELALQSLERIETLRKQHESTGKVNLDHVRNHLAQELPNYMMPSGFIICDTFPSTANGKVDRMALSRTVAPTPANHSPREELTTRMELEIAELWCEVLSAQVSSKYDNFFLLGGHSLLVAQLIARIRKKYKIEVPMGFVFECPVLVDQAKKIGWLINEDKQKPQGIISRPENKFSRLSFAEERLAFLDRIVPERALYNTLLSYRIRGNLDVSKLRWAINQLLLRHEVLRCRIVQYSDGFYREPCETSDIPFEVIPLKITDVARVSSELSRELRLELTKAFDLSQGPMLRAKLLVLDDEDYMFLLTTHHIASDGWSIGIINQELSTFYTTNGLPGGTGLPELPVQYFDYAVWQRERAMNGCSNSVQYWKKTLAGLPDELQLPRDRPRPFTPTYSGGQVLFKLDSYVVRQIKSLAISRDSTFFMTLLAMFQGFLHIYSGQMSIAVGSPVVNRNLAETENLIGLFLNTIVIRADFNGSLSFLDLLEKTRNRCLEAFAHQEVPFEHIVDQMQVERDLARNPLFQAMFVLRNVGEGVLKLADIDVEPVVCDCHFAKFDLTLWAEERGGTLELGFEYATQLFDRERIVLMADHFIRLIQAIVKNPETPISSHCLLGFEELDRQTCEWNANSLNYPRGETIHGLFERQARLTPDAIAAIEPGNHMITYETLNQRANQFAQYLLNRGIIRGTHIGICLNRSIEMLVVLLGVLKVGAAFVPLDPDYPDSHLHILTRDSCLKAVVVEEKFFKKFIHSDMTVIFATSESEQCELSVDFVACHCPESIAYIVYTSGSTGQPKGVMITHNNAVSMLIWSAERFSNVELAGTLASTSICFDLSVFEIFLPLSRGATVILSRNLLTVADLECRCRITLLNTVPSAMEALLKGKGLPESVRVINLAGEPLTGSLVERIYQHPNVEKIYNLYGPSECTTYSTWSEVPRNLDSEPLIGKAIANTQTYILGEDMQLLPTGVVGELYLGGDGVSLGYIGRPDLTARSFVPDPYSRRPGTRMYATGDLARYRLDGNIELLGRKDRQIKLRGFRIELAAVEAAVRKIDSINEVVVSLCETISNVKELVAFYTVNQGHTNLELADVELRDILRTMLPSYMIPVRFFKLEAIPVMPNGKINHAELAALEIEKPVSAVGILPEGAMEIALSQIWQNLLKTPIVFVDKNFFDSGGHSLLLAEFQVQIEKELGVSVPIVDMFKNPTIRELGKAILEKENKNSIPAVSSHAQIDRPLRTEVLKKLNRRAKI